MYKNLLTKLNNGENLSQDESKAFIDLVFEGVIPTEILTESLILLNKNGFGSEELTGFARSMRNASQKVICNKDIVDNCGTGGDGLGTFNISTTASLIAACTGVNVAKHGNKAITSNSGSADLLESAGVNIKLTPEQVGQCIDELNFGFMFAPLHHQSMKHVAESRKAIAPNKTIFNLLGPLTNPAGAKKQLIGVYSKDMMMPIAETLVNLGTERAMIVNSVDGLDEISIFEKTNIIEIDSSKVTSYIFDPSNYINCNGSLSDILVSSPSESLQMMQNVLNNTNHNSREISVINAGALVYISGITDSLNEAITLCEDVLESKKVNHKLKELISLTNSFQNA